MQIPSWIKCIVSILIMLILPVTLGAAVYSATVGLTGYFFGGWTIRTRWQSALLMLLLFAIAYIPYWVFWCIASRFLAWHVQKYSNA